MDFYIKPDDVSSPARAIAAGHTARGQSESRRYVCCGPFADLVDAIALRAGEAAIITERARQYIDIIRAAREA